MLISMEQMIKNLQQLHTVPVYSNQKRPMTAHGYLDGVQNADINSWLDRGFNVGISLSLSGLACIDVDMHGKENGLAEYQKLCTEYGIIDTYTEVTATGNGLHIIIHDDGITANNCVLAPGVEFKRNGLIVCSPSTINGVQYKIIGGINPDGSYKFAKAPTGWIEAINNASKNKSKSRKHHKFQSQHEYTAKDFGKLDYNKVFQNCRFLSYVKLNSAEISEPIWFAAVNMLSIDKNSDYIIHWLSEDYPTYSFEETQNKIEASRSSGKFCGCNFIARNYYDICKGCPKAEQIRGEIND